MKGKIPGNIDEYIADCPLQLHGRLNELWAAIRKAAPASEEKISYHMPAFYLNGPLVFFAAQKKQIGFIPHPPGLRHSERIWSDIRHPRVPSNSPMTNPCHCNWSKGLSGSGLRRIPGCHTAGRKTP